MFVPRTVSLAAVFRSLPALGKLFFVVVDLGGGPDATLLRAATQMHDYVNVSHWRLLSFRVVARLVVYGRRITFGNAESVAGVYHLGIDLEYVS